jgi:hypothetical protein
VGDGFEEKPSGRNSRLRIKARAGQGIKIILGRDADEREHTRPSEAIHSSQTLLRMLGIEICFSREMRAGTGPSR